MKACQIRGFLFLCLLAAGANACCVCSAGSGVRLTKPHAPGASLHFDGNDCVLIEPGNSLDLKGSMTVSAWVRSDGVKSSAEQIFWRGDTRPGLDPYSLVINDGRMAFVRMFNQETANQAIADFPVDRNYHFWTGVYDMAAGEIRLYMDGEQVATTLCREEIAYETAGMWNTIGAVDMGTWQNFNGDIREIQVWDSARNARQVANDMKDRPSAGTEGLAGHWLFDEGQGEVLHDKSGNGNDGRLGADDDRLPNWRAAEKPAR